MENPRHLKNALWSELIAHQRELARKRRGSRNRAKARQASPPCTRRSPIADNFLHKKAALVSVLAFIATEVFAVKNMTRRPEEGLNREILATSPALFLHMLRAKAEETWLHPHREAVPDLLGLRTAGAQISGAASPSLAPAGRFPAGTRTQRR